MSICDEMQDLYPAFVLDAVEESERGRIERHLTQCEACTQTVASLRPVADYLCHAAAPVEPPADLKARVLAATALAVPKLAPRKAPTRPRWDPVTALGGWLRSPALSALVLLLVLGLGAWDYVLQNQLTRQAESGQKVFAEMSRQRELVTTLAYANGQPKQLWGTQVASRAVGRLYGTPDESTLALIALDMPALPAGRVYQVWLIDAAGARISGGTFTVDEEGQGWLVIRAPKPLSSYQGVGITEEPEGGSPWPTGEKMLGTSL